MYIDLSQNLEMKKNSRIRDGDFLHIDLIKHVFELISPSLTHICNIDVRNDIIPKKMKRGKVSVL